MAIRSAVITVMANAALKCARGIARDYGEVENLQVSKKGPADFVTATDLKAEQVLHDELLRARPGYGFLLEESGAIAGEDTEHRWIVDPLDGTTNFLHGVPHFAISIALESKGVITAGLVYDPLRHEMFWAEDGAGAYLNDRRLRVSSRHKLSDALIATGMPFKGHASHPQYSRQLERVTAEVAGVRRCGSAALDLVYVAAGRFDGLWEYSLAPWDIAAGIVIVREAGGLVTEANDGHDLLGSGDVLAANHRLHPLIAALLADADRPASHSGDAS